MSQLSNSELIISPSIEHKPLIWKSSRDATPPREAAKKKILALLNKLTADKFLIIKERLLSLLETNKILGVELLRDTVIIIFDKALGETFFADIYSDMCEKISFDVSDIFMPSYIEELKTKNENDATIAKEDAKRLKAIADESMSKDDVIAAEKAMQKSIKADEILHQSIDDKKVKNMFRSILLNQCQREFQDGLKEIKSESKELDQQRAAQKRRFLGNIRFIGELYKKGMIIETIIHICVQHLLKDQPNTSEENLEVLCNLLSTTGNQLDQGRSAKNVDKYFQQIDSIIANGKLSNRVRFMLLDVIDLRKGKWALKPK